MGGTRGVRDEGKLRKLATDFWFAVQRMSKRKTDLASGASTQLGPADLGDDPEDDGLDTSRVPRHPAPSSGSATAAVPEPDPGLHIRVDG